MATNIMFEDLTQEEKQKLLYDPNTPTTIEYTDGTKETSTMINVIMSQYPAGTLIYVPFPGTIDTFILFKK